MIWFDGFVVTLFLYEVTLFIYATSQAILGMRFGANVESISVGCGPILCRWKWKGINCKVHLLPLGASTQFASQGDSSEDDPRGDSTNDGTPSHGSGKYFRDLPVSRQILVLLCGPLTTLGIGLVCMAIPIAMAGPQVVVDDQAPVAWTNPGVPGLTVDTQVSTSRGQYRLFRQTFMEFVRRVCTRESLKGWGGYFAWIFNCASAAHYSIVAWFSCFGTVIIGTALLNLLPIPPFNGGLIFFHLVDVVAGSESVLARATLVWVGMLIWFVFLVFVVCADITWFAGQTLGRK